MDEQFRRAEGATPRCARLERRGECRGHVISEERASATIKTPGEAVAGRFALIEFLFPRHASPPLHTDPQDESYIVLEGRLAIHAGERRFELEAGAAAVVPMGVPHTFRVDSDTARVLVLSTPAGLERLVRDAAVPANASTLPPADTPRPSAEELEAVFATHGQINLGPPMAPHD